MRAFLLMVVLLLAGCPARQQDPQPAYVGAEISGAELGTDFTLQDHTGGVRHLSDFKGKLVALFFGYTHCPDVCPTTLSDLAKALKLLGPDGDRVQVLFVTLDPERDTSEVLGRYVPSFNPLFIGLRGDEGTTRKVAQQFRIFYSKQASGSRSGYSIDHSAGVYVYDRKGNLRLYLSHGQGAKEIAHDFRVLLDRLE